MTRLTTILIAVFALAGALGPAGPAAAEVLWGADGAQGNLSTLYELDPATGAVRRIVGPIGFAVTGLAVHPTTGELYGSVGNASPNSPAHLIRIDKNTGAGTVVGPYNVDVDNSQTAADITFTSDGTLYGWMEPTSSIADDLYTINITTGQATKVGDSGQGTFGSGLAANASNVLFFAGNGENGRLDTVDRTTGATTQVATLGGSDEGESIAALAFNAAGTLFGVRLDTSTAANGLAHLITINTSTGVLTLAGETVRRLDAIAFDPFVAAACTPLPAGTGIVTSVLPTMRSVGMDVPPATAIDPATFFAAVINTGTTAACGCEVSPITSVPAAFLYQTTSPTTNLLVGQPNQPADIPPGGLQTFLLAFSPTAPFPVTDVRLSFRCANAPEAVIRPGLNTALISAEATPVPDIVALAATIGNDGIVNISGPTGTGVFAVATVNVGDAPGQITVIANTAGPFAGPGAGTLPVALALCETDPVTSACISPVGPTVVRTIQPGETPTVAVFVGGAGTVPFDPANNRIYVLFFQGGVLRGATSVAVRTQ